MKTSAFMFKYSHIFAGIVLVGIFSLAGCGGGDDGESVDIPATVPDVLNYEIKQTTGVNLVIDQAGNQVTVSSSLLTGSYNRLNISFTLLSSNVPLMSVSAGDFLNTLMSGEYNDFSLAVNTTLQWVGNGRPTSGEFDLRVGEVNRIRVSVNPNVQPSEAGVDITYSPNGEAGQSFTTSVTWDQFDSLFENDAAEDYAQVAAFAHGILRFMYEQGGLVINSLEYLSDNDTDLEMSASLAESCDSYPYPTDQNVSNPGESLITWYDYSYDGSLGPGDSFLIYFTECWDNNFDQMYHGELDLNNYVEVEELGVLTRIGFEPFGTTPGGIVYKNLEVTETETVIDDQMVYIDYTNTLTLNGGFSMVFTSP